MKETLQLPSRIKTRIAYKTDAVNAALDNATPEQISTWVDNNITGFNALTLTSLKKVIKLILLHIKSE